MFNRKNHNSICQRMDDLLAESQEIRGEMESLRLSRDTGFPRGCVVQLASGGPAMTVERVLQRPATNQEYARCLWFQDGRYIAAELSLEVLTRIDPFSPADGETRNERHCATIAQRKTEEEQ